VSAAVLFIAAVAFGGLLDFVPAAVLAGLLVTAGVGLIDRWTRGLVRRAARRGDAQAEIKWNLTIVAVVAGALFFGGVPLALLVGTVLAMVLLAHSLSAATSFLPEEGARFASTRIWPAEQAAWLSQARRVIRVLRPRGGLFFGTAEQLAEQLSEFHAPVRYCIIDCSRLTVVDATGCQIVAAGARKLAERRVTTLLAGLDPASPHDRALVALGLDNPSPAERWFPDLDHALEWVEAELLRERWPEVAADQGVDVGATQLAKGLPHAELEVLRSHLGATDVEAGKVLFERGAAGDALYVIGQGLIEIRVATDTPGGHTRRLAVFGPGCIFGETAMLMHGPRTADAVCVKPARLYELRRDALLELEGLFPVIHAKIMANLNLHLATRLAATTEIARGR
jgi:SulP family sulfate permease